MSSKKRYTKSFLLTATVYGVVFIAIFFSIKPIIQTKTIMKEKTIALNHISLITQEKQEIKKEPKKEPKEKPKEEPKPKELKKEILKPKPIKKEDLKPIKKVEPKPKNKSIEEPKKEIVKKAIKEEEVKEFKKEQEAMQKSLPQNYEQEFLDEHLQQIVKLIQQHIIYPKRAKRLNIQGEVLLKFKILKNGTTQNIEALKGHMLLKSSTLEAIEKASKKFPKVKKDITIQVPIVYSLVNKN